MVGPDGKLADGTPVTSLIPARIRRLTNAEYDASVRVVTGTSLAPGQGFAPDLRQDGYTLNDAQRVDPVLAKQLFAAARDIAAEVKAKAGTVAPCADQASGAEACATSFIQSFGAQAYRRPLESVEIEGLLTVYRAAASGGTYEDGIELVVQAVLQSAGFLYVTELGSGTGAAVSLTPLELASSLSYFLTESPPDAELLAAAEAGQLATADGREAQARRLLNTQAARARVVRMLREWLGVDRIATTAKDTTVYPMYDGLKAAMEKETDDFIAEVIGNSTGTVGELLGADFTVADAPLVSMYGGSGSGRVTLADRRGVLNQGAFLSVYAHAHESAPVLRGVAVMRRVACQAVASPTSLNIQVVPPVPDPSKTTRERFVVHSTDTQCASCHSAIDAFGFSFEQFDGMGAKRTMENGKPVDSAVNLAIGADFDGTYANSNELALALSQSATVRACFARNMFRASAGRSDETVIDTEQAFIDFWQTVPAAEQGNIVETLVTYVRSSLFTERRAQ